jgi:hypothetical protein
MVNALSTRDAPKANIKTGSKAIGKSKNANVNLTLNNTSNSKKNAKAIVNSTRAMIPFDKGIIILGKCIFFAISLWLIKPGVAWLNI